MPIHRCQGTGETRGILPGGQDPTKRGTFLFQIQLFHIETAIRWLRSATGSVRIHINTDGCGHVCVYVCVLVDKRCCENGRQNESQLVFLVFPSAVFIFLYSCPFVAFFFLTVQMSLASWEKRAGKKRKNCRHIGKLSAHVKKLLCALGHSFVWAAGN